MGKQLKKKTRVSPRQLRKGMRRVIHTFHERVSVGFTDGDPRPSSFWWRNDPYSIMHILKEWTDDWGNKHYHVITDKGAFHIYRHRKIISLAEKRFEYHWWLESEIELYKLKLPQRKLTDREVPWYWKSGIYPREASADGTHS
ncbi:MAG TPA: hypothetical protein GXX51_08605 [Firmicutes bacterium]|nr:hypothetical protein [Bacillota bacterium]